MTIDELIARLESLKANSSSFITKDEPDSIWVQDVEALEIAIALLRDYKISHKVEYIALPPKCKADTREEKPMHSFFYTFGTDPEYPYGEKDFVEVRAETWEKANQKYQTSIPNRPGSVALNCAFVYTEEQWINGGIRDLYYRDREAARIIE